MMALVLLFRYLHMLSGDQTDSVPIIGLFRIKQSYELLILIALAGLVLLTLAGITKYVGELGALKIMANYETYCVERAVLAIARYGGDERLSEWKPLYLKIVGPYARCCGSTARTIIKLSLPLAVALSTITWLFYFDWILTGILFLMMLAATPLLIKINLRGAKYSTVLENQGHLAGISKKTAINNLSFRLQDSMDEKALYTLMRQEIRPAASVLDAFSRRLRTTEESGLLMTVLMGVSIFVILLVKGLGVLGNAQSWAVVVAYFFVLRICFGAAMQCATMLTGMNRMYPQVSRYQAFMEKVSAVAKDVNMAPFVDRLGEGKTGSTEGDGDETS